jgi:hypothetical protein
MAGWRSFRTGLSQTKRRPDREHRTSTDRGPQATCLAPDIVEAILDGRQPKGLRLAEVLGNGPGSWEDQRRAFGFRQSA